MENWGTYVRRQAQIQARRVFCWVLPQAAVFRRKGLIRRVVGSWDSCSAEKNVFLFVIPGIRIICAAVGVLSLLHAYYFQKS